MGIGAESLGGVRQAMWVMEKISFALSGTAGRVMLGDAMS